MKQKIVLWGNNEKEEKLLVAIELLVKENKVKIITLEESLATEEVYNAFMEQWRNNIEMILPEGVVETERPLLITEDILPENIKITRADVINRAKSEWHFAVLSSKMYESYQGELETLKDKIESLVDYDKGIWEEMKAFWNKVQTQVRERNLDRAHADTLKEVTNTLFDQLKSMRKKMDEEFNTFSGQQVDKFFAVLKTLEEKIEKGLGLQPIFNELKNLQNEYRNTKMNRKDKNKVWDRLDAAFKKVKEKRFGKQGVSDHSPMDRLKNRYQGLLKAIDRMQKSIQRDKNDMSYETRKSDQSDGQLEAQLRQAKVRMIEERVKSKQSKLDDMIVTKTTLESKMKKEEKRLEKAAVKQKIELEKAAVKQKIAEEIKEKNEKIEDKSKLEKAAAAIASTKKRVKTKKLIDSSTDVVSETEEDNVHTVKAVAQVKENKIVEVSGTVTSSKKKE